MEKADTPRGILSNSGFTMVEMLIALSILSIGILAVASMQFSAVGNTAIGNKLTMANNLAQAQIENLKRVTQAVDLESVAGSDDTDGDDSFAYVLEVPVVEANIDEFGNAGGIFTRTTLVQCPVHTPGACDGPPCTSEFSRLITVTVEWERHMGRGGGRRTITCVALTQGKGV